MVVNAGDELMKKIASETTEELEVEGQSDTQYVEYAGEEWRVDRWGEKWIAISKAGEAKMVPREAVKLLEPVKPAKPRQRAERSDKGKKRGKRNG